MAAAPEPPPPGRPRRSPWRVVAYAVAAIVVAAVGVVVLVRVRAARTIDRYRAEVEAAAAVATVRTRPACWGPAVAGDAAEAFERAVAALDAIPTEDRDRVDAADDAGAAEDPDAADDLDAAARAAEVAVERAARDAVVDAHPEVAAALLEVPRRSATVRPAPPSLAELAAGRERLARMQRLRRWVSLGEVPRRRARGDADGALRVLSAQLVAEADVDRHGGLVDRLSVDAGVRRAARAFADVLAAGGLRPEALADAGRALDGLDAAARSWGDVAAAARVETLGLWTAASLEGDALLPKAGWRACWSFQVLRAQALVELDDTGHRIATVLRDPSFPGPGLADRVRDVVGAAGNPITRLMLVPWPYVTRTGTEAAAGRRVVRAALAVAACVAATGRAPASLEALVPTYLAAVPRDPWDGAPLRYAPGPPPRVWSIGEDRVDGGGARPTDPDPDMAPPDVTVELSPPAGR